MYKHFSKYLKIVAVQPVWGHHPFMAVCARCARFYCELQLWFISLLTSGLQPDKERNWTYFHQQNSSQELRQQESRNEVKPVQ